MPHIAVENLRDLHERDKEIIALGRFLADRAGGIRIISGTAGIGKSALVDVASRLAGERGFNVFRACGGRLEKELSFGVLSQFMHNTTWRPDIVPGGSFEFPERIVDARGADRAEIDQVTLWNVLHDWCSLIGRASRSGPVLLVIDDLHQADAPSLYIVQQLLRRSATTPLWVLVGVCAADRPATLVALSELRRHPRCRTLRLAALSERSVAAMLTERLDRLDVAGLAAQCHRASGGNPLLVQALIEDQVAAGEPAELAAGEAFELAVYGIAQQVEPQAGELARTAAVLGDPAMPALLAKLLGVTTTRLAELSDCLSQAGILGADLTFRHPAARRALRHHVDPAAEAETHYRAAEWLCAQNVPATVIGRHLLAAGPRREAWVAPVLKEAARQAVVEGSLDLSVELLELATQCTVAENDRVNINVALAAAAWQRNPQTVARYLESDATDASREPLGRHDVEAVRYLLWHGRVDEATHRMRRLLDCVAELDREVLVELEALKMWLGTTFPSVLDRLGVDWLVLLDEHRSRSTDVMDERAQASALLATVLANKADDTTVMHAEQLLRRVLGAGPTAAGIAAASQVELALIYGEQTELARRAHERLMETPVVRASPTWRAKLLCAGAELALHEGDLARAADLARDALEVIPVSGWGIGAGMPLGVLIESLTLSGDQAGAESLLRHPVPDKLPQSRYGLYYLSARGQYYLASGAYQAALDDFVHCGQLMEAWRMDLPALIAWRSRAAAAWVRLGDRDRARQLLGDELALVPASGGRSRARALRALAELEQPPPRDPLTGSVELVGVGGDRHQHGPALVDLTRRWRHGRHKGLMEVHRQQHPDGDAGRPTPLSRAESRVAWLAADGYTNREIAAKLFITMSTVEQHLTRIYRKLSVPGRAELSKTLGGRTRLLGLTPPAVPPRSTAGRTKGLTLVEADCQAADDSDLGN